MPGAAHSFAWKFHDLNKWKAFQRMTRRDTQLMLALASPAEHSGLSLTTTYETIAYHIHCSSIRYWLDDVMRQQKGIHDDNRHDVQLNRGDHEEGYGREERDGGNDHQEDLDQKEERNGYVAVSIGVACWLESGWAPVSG